MSIPLETVDQLQEYFRRVVERSDHHALAVREVLPVLAGVIIYHKDPTTPLMARTHSGALANVLWVTIGGHRYVLSYDHDGERVVLLEGTLRGHVIAAFDGTSTVAQVNETFARLALPQATAARA